MICNSRYNENLELDDAVHTAILTLKESFEGQVTADNIEVGIADKSGFRVLDPATVKDYLWFISLYFFKKIIFKGTYCNHFYIFISCQFHLKAL